MSIGTLAFDADSKTLAALDRDGRTLRLHGAAESSLALDPPAATVTPGRAGEVLLPADRRVTRVDVRTGTTTVVTIDGDARSAAVLPDGRLVVGTTDGTTRIVDTDTGATTAVDGLASVDAVAVTGDDVTALDRRQTSVTEIDGSDRSLGLSLRAGEGAANLTTDHFGRILVTDTTGNELIVFTTAPLVMRQRYPVGSSPYGVAYDNGADIAWVTLTSTNEVVGYDLSAGIPKEVGRFATVRQPDSVAVDSDTGDLYVGSAVGDGLQRIPGGRG